MLQNFSKEDILPVIETLPILPAPKAVADADRNTHRITHDKRKWDEGTMDDMVRSPLN